MLISLRAVLPAGIEPALRASEARVLSVKLRELVVAGFHHYGIWDFICVY